jgi:patatin-like phospholipase
MVAPKSTQSSVSSEVLTTEEVLREEAKAIHNLDLSETGPALYDALFKRRSAALCLSGGGIRSAAFALGVLQALAAHPRPVQGHDRSKVDQDRNVGSPERSLLAQFRYLSTVSGGGYIGSWLSAWVTRAGFPTVWRSLVGRPQGPDIEPPRGGVASGLQQLSHAQARHHVGRHLDRCYACLAQPHSQLVGHPAGVVPAGPCSEAICCIDRLVLAV